jgi:hypothetical protein
LFIAYIWICISITIGIDMCIIIILCEQFMWHEFKFSNEQVEVSYLLTNISYSFCLQQNFTNCQFEHWFWPVSYSSVIKNKSTSNKTKTRQVVYELLYRYKQFSKCWVNIPQAVLNNIFSKLMEKFITNCWKLLCSYDSILGTLLT